MRFIFLFIILATSFVYAQVSNVRQTVDNGRIIITYDLRESDGKVYDIEVTAINENGEIITPRAIVGDLVAVTPGNGRSIWWETTLDGMVTSGWKINLTLTGLIDIGITWVLVKGGPGGDFYIFATEVTFDQYDKFCDATGYKKPEADFGRGNQPVINVNVADAVAFCKWLSKETGTTVRLPQENEWEYAAKGGNKSKGYKYSGSNIVDEVAWNFENSGEKAHEVATKKPNELGIYDMSGNVWEWCGTSGALRGGSWGNGGYSCRVSFRLVCLPDYRGSSLGFRVLQKR